MDQFLDIALSFPTVAMTALLAAVLGYWLLVALGLLDIDLFDLDLDLYASPALEGAGEALDGLGEGLEGGQGADGADGDADTAAGGWVGATLRALGLSGVPLTVSLSLVVLAGWVATYLGSRFVGAAGGPLGAELGLAVLAAGTAVGVGVAAVGVKPLRPVFRTHQAASIRSFVGRECTVTTLSVTESFGQAEIDDGGAGLLVQVRTRREGTALGRGSKALIFDYDGDDEVFLVVPLTAELGDEGSTTPRPPAAAPRSA